MELREDQSNDARIGSNDELTNPGLENWVGSEPNRSLDTLPAHDRMSSENLENDQSKEVTNDRVEKAGSSSNLSTVNHETKVYILQRN